MRAPHNNLANYQNNLEKQLIKKYRLGKRKLTIQYLHGLEPYFTTIMNF